MYNAKDIINAKSLTIFFMMLNSFFYNFSSQIQNSLNDFNNHCIFNIAMRIFYNNEVKRWNYKIDSEFSFNAIISWFNRARIEIFECKKRIFRWKRTKISEFAIKNEKFKHVLLHNSMSIRSILNILDSNENFK